MLYENTEFRLYCSGYETETFNHPASKETISQIMICVAKESNKWDVLKNESCAICQEQFQDETIIMELKCHTFCKNCLQVWIEKHSNTCPVCRALVE